MSSASPKTASASGRIRAPCATYMSSVIADPSPAPACTSTSWPWSVSSRTPDGVSATRYSSALISVGTPTFTGGPRWIGGWWSWSHAPRRPDDLAPAQRQPELDAVARRGQVAPGQLLDLADPVAQRVAVAVQAARRRLPLAVALDEGLQRAHELAPVVALAALDRAEQRLTEEAQRVRVLQRQQQLEGPEVTVGGHAGGERGVLAGAAVGARGAVRGRAAVVGAEHPRLQRAAGLVVGLACAPGGHRAPCPGRRARAQLVTRAAHDALGQFEELLVGEGRQERADMAAGRGHQAADRLRPQGGRDRGLDRVGRAAGRDHERAHPPPEPERLQA